VSKIEFSGKAGSGKVCNNRAALVRELMWIHYPSVCGRSSAEHLPEFVSRAIIRMDHLSQLTAQSICPVCSAMPRTPRWVGLRSFKRPFLSSAGGVYFAAGYFSF